MGIFKTFKAFTDIEQSKKLAEILPVKSADMVYIDAGYCSRVLPSNDIDANSYPTICPCWSLAALLNLLPSVITRNGKRMFLTLEKAGAYNLYYKSPDRLDELWETKEDAIDACYELILKLHEQKLL